MSLRAQSVSVSIGRKTILDGVDFSAEPGALTAIVGPNGSGKTTLLRALVGELPATGVISLNGTDLARLKPWEIAAIRGVLPQATVLSFPFTVIEVIRMGLQSGLHATEPGVAQHALQAVGLTGYEERFFQELSGGEQQRAQLARVLAQVWAPMGPDGPRWLFLDEPVASLDIGHQLSVMQLARRYADAGGGVVAVMHDLNLTAMFADSVTLMADGAVLSAGPVIAVLTDPLLSSAYGCALRVNTAPGPGATYLLPHAAVQVSN